MAIDSSNPGVIYASTYRGEIFIFESFSRGENMECKLKGKLHTELSLKDNIFSNKPTYKPISLSNSNNLLYAYLFDGTIQIYKTFDIIKLITEDN